MTNIERVREMNAMELAYFILHEAPKIAEQYVPAVNGLATWLEQNQAHNSYYENNALSNNSYSEYMYYLSGDVQLTPQEDGEE
jgi:hypothetical protein